LLHFSSTDKLWTVMEFDERFFRRLTRLHAGWGFRVDGPAAQG